MGTFAPSTYLNKESIHLRTPFSPTGLSLRVPRYPKNNVFVCACVRYECVCGKHTGAQASRAWTSSIRGIIKGGEKFPWHTRRQAAGSHKTTKKPSKSLLRNFVSLLIAFPWLQKSTIIGENSVGHESLGETDAVPM